jgi:hypothetical protein
LRFTTERNANVRADTHKISTRRSQQVPKEKTPPESDGALKCFAGLWRQPRPTHATIFLHYSKYPRNAFDVSPTVGRSRTQSGLSVITETPNPVLQRADPGPAETSEPQLQVAV